jgi:hypothetical protein
MLDDLEKLLKKTEYRKEAKEIAAKIHKAGLTLATIADAPRIFGHNLWGHNTYQVIDAIQRAMLIGEIQTPVTIKNPIIEPIEPEPEDGPAKVEE